MLTLLTYKDLSAMLQVPEATLKDWKVRHPDKLPPYLRIGRNVRWHPETVEKWLHAKNAKGRKLFGGS